MKDGVTPRRVNKSRGLAGKWFPRPILVEQPIMRRGQEEFDPLRDRESLHGQELPRSQGSSEIGTAGGVPISDRVLLLCLDPGVAAFTLLMWNAQFGSILRARSTQT